MKQEQFPIQTENCSADIFKNGLRNRSLSRNVSMKRVITIALLLCSVLQPAFAMKSKPQPQNLTMTLAWVADEQTDSPQYLFVINGVLAYKTVNELKRYLKNLPGESTLTWAPRCCRMGNEPLLNSQDDMKNFQEFCESNNIGLIIVPSG